MSAADFTPERLAELRGFDWRRFVVVDGRDSDTGEPYRAVKYVDADVEVRSMLDAIEELQAANKRLDALLTRSQQYRWAYRW